MAGFYFRYDQTEEVRPIGQCTWRYIRNKFLQKVFFDFILLRMEGVINFGTEGYAIRIATDLVTGTLD